MVQEYGVGTVCARAVVGPRPRSGMDARRRRRSRSTRRGRDWSRRVEQVMPETKGVARGRILRTAGAPRPGRRVHDELRVRGGFMVETHEHGRWARGGGWRGAPRRGYGRPVGPGHAPPDRRRGAPPTGPVPPGRGRDPGRLGRRARPDGPVAGVVRSGPGGPGDGRYGQHDSAARGCRAGLGDAPGRGDRFPGRGPCGHLSPAAPTGRLHSRGDSR